MARTLTALLDAERIGVLDGGLATYLEDGLGYDLSQGPLWSARLLDGDDAVGLRTAHADYTSAGAQLIGTATYQASHESFERAGYTRAKADELMRAAVVLASESSGALVCLSLGPYGAMLANGSEYTGNYAPTPDAAQPSVTDMCNFHLGRLQTFASHKATWDAIDVLTLETVPRQDEALAFRQALDQLELPQGADKKPVYISFAFPDDKALPWPRKDESVSGSASRHTSSPDEQMVSLLRTVLDPAGSNWPIAGVGINCTKPYLLPVLVDRMTRALLSLQDLTDRRSQAGIEAPLLFLYPDGGLVYDPVNKIWLQPQAIHASATDSADAWAQNLFNIARQATTSPSSPWRGAFVGGCCKSGTQEIAALCRCRSSSSTSTPPA